MKAFFSKKYIEGRNPEEMDAKIVLPRSNSNRRSKRMYLGRGEVSDVQAKHKFMYSQVALLGTGIKIDDDLARLLIDIISSLFH